MPTLALRGTFSFYKDAVTTDEQRVWMQNLTAIQIIIQQLRIKFGKQGKQSRLYFLKGRTGSGKSTLMISSFFESLIRGSRGKLICSEPRVVLTKANATDVVRYNKQYEFGKQMGVLSGAEKIFCSESECMYYCTPQILNDQLLSIIQLTDKPTIKQKLARFKIVVVDEVHVLDLPMMALLKTVKDTVDHFGDYEECPMFVFASATINVEQMTSYFFGDSANNVVRDPLLIGEVAGSSNFHVDEYFLEPSEIAKYNEMEKQRGRGGCFSIMAEYFYKHYYPLLYKSESYVNTKTDKFQCRDVLFFVPLVSGIDIIGMTLKNLIKDRPVFVIAKGTEMSEVTSWRLANKGKERILVVGFARGFAPASDELLSKPMETDVDSLYYESRIVVATPVIETGKTIVTLYICVDMGLQTTTVYNPLVHNFNESLQALKQIPANLNQTIQRMGRVGREAPGKYLHFYSKDIMSHFQLSDTADTINNACLSNLLLTHFKSFPLYSVFDVTNENHYLYPTTVDIIIRSMHDLIYAGFFTIYGELVNLKTSYKYVDSWILYAEYLYYIKGYSLFESLLLSAINRKTLPSLFTIRDLDPKKLRWQLDSILTDDQPDEIVEGIQLARNTMTLIQYSQQNMRETRSPPSLVYIKDKVYGDTVYVKKERERNDGRGNDRHGNGHNSGHGNERRNGNERHQ